MEQVIGIFDGQAEYAGRLARYINERKDVGCFAIVFREEGEVLSFCERKRLNTLIVGGKSAEELKELKDRLPVGTKVWLLSENRVDVQEEALFRYQKAEGILRVVLEEFRKETGPKMSELLTVFSPENNRIAAQYALSLAEAHAKTGRTLLVPWDAFLGYGRVEQEESPTLSELLYFIRKDTVQAKKLFDGIRKKTGVEYFCGPEYCTDLWQYSPEEMQKLLLCCKEYGEYDHIIFLAGMFHECTKAVMHQSNRIYLVCSKEKENNGWKEEFFRQMKYAGEQEILSKLTETEGRDVT